MSRTDVGQKPPAPGLDLTDFPPVQDTSGRKYRAHNEGLGVWYFRPRDLANDPGRFDVDDPDGTCYMADSRETAVRESLANHIEDHDRVSSALVTELTVTAVDIPATMRIAALNGPRGVRYGVRREISTMTEYLVPQEWADAFHKQNFDGVNYESRFTSEAGSHSYALFGKKGPQPTLPSYPAEEMTGLDACQAAGISVWWPPESKTLQFVEKAPLN